MRCDAMRASQERARDRTSPRYSEGTPTAPCFASADFFASFEVIPPCTMSVAAELSSLELVLQTQDTGKKKKKKGEDPKVLVPWRTS